MYLHLLHLADTISCTPRPRDMKNGAKTNITQYTHQITTTTKITHMATKQPCTAQLGNESSFLHLAYITETISYGTGPRDTNNDNKKTIVGNLKTLTTELSKHWVPTPFFGPPKTAQAILLKI